ncbi:MAG: hypothetical protein WC901_08120 [Candidatus Margulisiibacteriota bacterium]
MVRLEASANCHGTLSKAWYHSLRVLHRKDVSLREMIGFRFNSPTILAIGGNSVGQLLSAIVLAITFFRLPVLTHGNGPQVGKLLAADPGRSFPECVAQTQIDIGNELKNELLAQLKVVKGAEYAAKVQIEVIPTQVVVDANDPAFNNPTKPVGVWYSFEEMQGLGSTTRISDTHCRVEVSGSTWDIKRIPGAKDAQPWRRVVASPKPLSIHPVDMQKIRAAIAAGKIVIACGGGGVPVVHHEDGTYEAVAGVIDKDLASAVLAAELKARELIISTGKLTADYFGIESDGQPVSRPIDYMQLKYALQSLRGGTIAKADILEAFGKVRGKIIWRALRHSNFIQGGLLWGPASIHTNFGQIDEPGFASSMLATNIFPLSDPFTNAEMSTAYQMVRRAQKGQYPAGSMGEKIEAAVNALRRGVNLVMITHPNMAWIKFEGTLLTRGFDLTGRIYNAGRLLGNWLENGCERPSWLPDNYIQRWLV